MMVVDASLVLDLLLRGPGCGQIETRLFGGGESLAAPHVLDLEVAQVARRYVLIGKMPPSRGDELLRDLLDLPVERYSHDWMLPRIWQLRENLTAYDAAYLALAEALGEPLVTRDAKLRAAPGHRAVVEVLECSAG